ncbi:MAG: hypothetical protein CMN75_10195 [Spirochaeta sp.]|nr:hypothetical protein [Spirochaeta sp.]
MDGRLYRSTKVSLHSTPTSCALDPTLKPVGFGRVGLWPLLVLGLLQGLLIPHGAIGSDVSQSEPVCSIEYALPGDIAEGDSGEVTSGTVAQFSWQTFLGLSAPRVGGQISLSGDNRPQWASWSSTADLLNQRKPGRSGSRSYPAVCQEIKGHWRYRALQQVGKVNDSFLEADRGKLSNQPVIDRNGNFLRYEILLSPAFYKEVKRRRLYDPLVLQGLDEDLNLSCGQGSYTGGDPADREMGSMVLKAAWMEAEELSESERATMHMENLLVFSPGEQMSTGEDACELKEMALVGLHVVRKTLLQPGWVWSTWEHEDNAPDCAAQIAFPKGGPGSAGANSVCPTELDRDYNFNSKGCAESDACNDCNADFTSGNAVLPGQCVNPDDPDDLAWCLDLPPASVKGKSQICRQIPVRHGVCSQDATALCMTDADCEPDDGVCVDNYPASSQWNAACQGVINEEGDGSSVWSHYELISSQWSPKDFDGCENVQAAFFAPSGTIDRNGINPQVQLEGPVVGHSNRSSRPFLGNSSMESYERSNCLGCHASANLPAHCAEDPFKLCQDGSDCDSGECAQYSSDFQYWLDLEVASRPSFFLDGLRLKGRFKKGGGQDSLQIKTQEVAQVVPERSSSDDPRCNEDPVGTVKASFRIFDDESGFDSGEVDLPCEHWRAMGRRSEGYRYRNPDGVCEHVMIKKGRALRVKCRDADLESLLPAEGSSYAILLSLGRERYCSRFGDFQTLSRARFTDFSGVGVGTGDTCALPDH